MVKFVPASEFTVGWVCALPIELAAAAEILDEEYSSVQKHASDPNIYTLGRIGGLNVVIASLPGGKTGTNQAAIVAVQMKMTFGSLRFSILVGVGGGVPNPDNDDIRLGDVVISQPYGEHGGIVQYDSGKLVPGGQTRTGSLSSPDSTFLQAAAILRSNQYRKKLGSVYSHLNKICSNPEFSPPGPEQDVLYTASTEHFGSASNCERCPADGIIPRAPRPNTFPKAFFGTIASGNLVIKDGEARDKLSKNLGGVLCFEMEAAGLIASNSSMVVRGICDYADAHKNKQWQPYAAAVAAAFAKELLLIISPDVAARQDEATESPSHGIRSNAEPSREKKEPRSHGHRGSGTSTKADKKSRNRDRDTTWSGWSDWQWSDEQGCYYAVRTNERGLYTTVATCSYG